MRASAGRKVHFEKKTAYNNPNRAAGAAVQCSRSSDALNEVKKIKIIIKMKNCSLFLRGTPLFRLAIERMARTRSIELSVVFIASRRCPAVVATAKWRNPFSQRVNINKPWKEVKLWDVWWGARSPLVRRRCQVLTNGEITKENTEWESLHFIRARFSFELAIDCCHDVSLRWHMHKVRIRTTSVSLANFKCHSRCFEIFEPNKWINEIFSFGFGRFTRSTRMVKWRCPWHTAIVYLRI